MSVPSTLTALEVSGSCTERGTEPSAPRWKTISAPRIGVVHALVAPQLALDDLDVEAVEVLAVAGREVVEHAHLVAALEQRAHEVRADEAAAAGDEDARHQATASTWKFANSEPGIGSRSDGSARSTAAAETLIPAISGRASTRTCARLKSRSM